MPFFNCSSLDIDSAEDLAVVTVVVALVLVLRSRQPLSSPRFRLSEETTADLFEILYGGLELEALVTTEVGESVLGVVEAAMTGGRSIS